MNATSGTRERPRAEGGAKGGPARAWFEVVEREIGLRIEGRWGGDWSQSRSLGWKKEDGAGKKERAGVAVNGEALSVSRYAIRGEGRKTYRVRDGGRWEGSKIWGMRRKGRGRWR